MTKAQRRIRRRTFLLGLSTMASMGALLMANKFETFNKQVQKAQYKNFQVVGNAALKTRAAAKKLIYGVASQHSVITSDKEFAKQVAQEASILMSEADLLWSALCPSPDTYDFSRGDWLADFARQREMLFGATHLVWSQSLPSWFESTVDQANASKFMLNHIQTVVEHYAGKVHLWTVVNEAVDPAHGRDDGLSNTIWLKLLGPNYIDMAFRAAAQADPNALLMYNDNALEYDIPYHDKKRTAVLKLLERLKSRGIPIHAFGLQTHVGADMSEFNPKKLSAFLHEVGQLGLKILVTEMDVGDKELPKNIAVRDRMVATAYEEFLSTILNEPAVIGAITWGLSDKYTWLSWFAPRSDGTQVRPLPLDANMHRKLAWNAIARAFDNATERRYSSKLWNAWESLNRSRS